ncbi:unnamed protein product [Heterotrigona itama]|uniref:Uncharacterized protein n=1 Tax=Heterotrigona itama TaxID=395501 RepID=A0A6V7GTM4_9HYME|nr:unnamed protein product [Heterotrigona itama]
MPAVWVTVGDVAPCALSLQPLRGCSAVAPQRDCREVCRGLPGETRINQCVPSFGKGLRDLRSDTQVVTHEPSRTVAVIDVTVSFENKFDSLESAGIEETRIYQQLVECLRKRGYIDVYVDSFVLGALGA